MRQANSPVTVGCCEDKPKVKPLTLTKVSSEVASDDSTENDLQQICAEVLEMNSGIARRKKESIHDYLHRAFDKHFGNTK